MTNIGTPFSSTATKVMLCGGGELGKVVVIELKRLGCEVIVLDRYENAPGMQVADRSYCISMLDGDALRKIYQGNVFTPLALVQTFLPSMLERGSGTILNMVSHAAFHDPPAPPDQGGWGFAYPSSKAAIARLVASPSTCGGRE